MSLSIFWIYGCKETNLFFIPLLFFLKSFRKNYQLIFKILLFGLLFYIIEGIFLYLFSDQNFIFGRIVALLTSESGHINAMKEGYGLENYKNLSKYESSLLPFYRWYSAREWDTTIFYISFVLSVFFLFNYAKLH